MVSTWYQNSIRLLETGGSQAMNKGKRVALKKETDNTRAANIEEGSRESGDIVEISENWTENADWNSIRQQILDTVKQMYPNVKIHMEEEGQGIMSEEELRRLAARSGDGIFLIISKDFYEGLSSGAERFEYYRTLLEDVCSQITTGMDGVRSFGVYLGKMGMRYWAVAEEKQNSNGITRASPGTLQNSDSTKAALQFGSSGTANSLGFRYSAGSADYDVAGKYAKVAWAVNKPQVQLALSEVNQSISALRLVACLGEKSEKQKASMAIRSFQKLLQRGRKKIKRFDMEQVLQLREKRALEQELRKKAERIRQEIQKARNKRILEDHLTEEEGKDESRKMSLARQRYEMADARLQMSETEAGSGSVAPLDAEGGGELDLSAFGGGFTEAAVAVSAEIAF